MARDTVARDTVTPESEKVAELGAIIQAVRDRVRARYPEADTNGHGAAANGNGPQSGDPGQNPIRIQIADLTPLLHARDAAQARIAAIGSVNPRAGGPINDAIQAVKKTIARALQWFVRDQVSFNRETVSAIEAVIEALNDHNRAAVSLAAQVNEQMQGLMELKDIRSHFPEMRAEWDRKVATNEIQFLRAVADLQGAFQHRSALTETNFREVAKAQHDDYQNALTRTTLDIQDRLWGDMRKIREEYDRLIHTELRLIRQRQPVAEAAAVVTPPPTPEESRTPGFDYGRFAERFRGAEDYVRRAVEFYKPFFADRENVLDIGCGRGEFLQLMRELEVKARGIDLSDESVAQCRQKGLEAEVADLFIYLASQPEREFDGILSSQVVEHLNPGALPEMIRLCASRLRRGGLLAIETPNPECLAIFATHFYLDPTHTRPVPHPLLAFYMEEAGLGSIEVHELSPAIESMPEVAELPEAFRRKFFGGLDYAIVGRKL
ncbi:MAG: class I SAM-dependent methyltransferase [Acidobacteriota bacterium]|nr:class I SAM-dependent methyltransferase [Acidobacteriota bacterium]